MHWHHPLCQALQPGACPFLPLIRLKGTQRAAEGNGSISILTGSSSSLPVCCGPQHCPLCQALLAAQIRGCRVQFWSTKTLPATHWQEPPAPSSTPGTHQLVLEPCTGTSHHRFTLQQGLAAQPSAGRQVHALAKSLALSRAASRNLLTVCKLSTSTKGIQGSAQGVYGGK